MYVAVVPNRGSPPAILLRESYREAGAALKEAAEYAATSVRRGLESDIEGAGLKARAIVDALYRAQSRVAMWMWIGIGMLAGTALFGAKPPSAVRLKPSWSARSLG